MYTLFFSSVNQNKMNQLKIATKPLRNERTSSKFIVAETLTSLDDYVSYFQKNIQESLHFQLLYRMTSDPFIFNKDLIQMLYISESTFFRKMKELKEWLQAFDIQIDHLSHPTSKLAEIQRRTIFIPIIAFKQLDLPTLDNIELTLFSLISEKKSIWNSALNHHLSVNNSHPTSFFFESEANYEYLWKLILGIEAYPIDSQFSRNLWLHIPKKRCYLFSGTEKCELGRLFLFFHALYPWGIPRHLYEAICKRYIIIKKNYPCVIDQYSLLLAFFLFP